jgi:Flp pilus assembly pilin Flp
MLKYDSRYKEQSGQGAMEYALILLLVMIVAFVLLIIVAPALEEIMQEILEGLDSVALMMGVA